MPAHFIVVGAGYAGLTAAIELSRKGFDVEVFESAKRFTRQGDILVINPSVTRIMSKWGETLEQVKGVSTVNDHQTIYDHHGNVIISEPQDFTRDGFRTLMTPRGYLHLIIYEHAKSIGVKVHFGTPITEVFEDDDCAGVYVDGKRIVADGVIAADGVHSKVRRQILQDEGRTQSSGFAIYRSFYDTERLLDDPKTRAFIEGPKDDIAIWIGPDAHALVLTDKKIGKIGCFLTHKDDYTVDESWTAPGSVPDMLKIVEGWDETLRALFSKIPPNELFDWKLLWRDPLKDWTSPKRRIVLIGDAVHPHLPTSGSGAMQAIEDGATIGALVDKLGSENIPEIFKVFQLIRYERTNLTQHIGWENRHKFHQTDWEAVKKNPGLIKIVHDEWLLSHDAEKYAEENAENALQALRSGTPFKSTNVPDEYVHQDWDVKSLMELDAQRAH